MNEFERISVSFLDRFGMNHECSFDMSDLIRLQHCLTFGYAAFSDHVYFECVCKRFDVHNGLVAKLIADGWLSNS